MSRRQGRGDHRRGRAAWLWLILASLTLTGCAGFRWSGFPPDVTPAREQRLHAAIEWFEDRRSEAEYRAARDQWIQGDTEGCRETLAAILKRQPAHRAAALLWAEVHLEQQTPALAIEVLEEAMAGSREDAALEHALGQVLLAAGQRQGGLVHLRRAARLAPTQQAWAAELAQAEADSPPRGAASPTSAIEPTVRTTANSEPTVHAVSTDDPDVAVRAAVAAMRQKDMVRAEQILREAAAQHPESAGVQRAWGAALLEQGRLAQAETVLRVALRLDRRSGLTYFLLGSVCQRQGRAAAARDWLEQARQLDPQWAERVAR